MIEGFRTEDTAAETLCVYFLYFYGGNKSSLAPFLSRAPCIIHIPDVEHVRQESQVGTEKRMSPSKATLRIYTTRQDYT